ncbi:chemotaxis protein CheX [Deltaproteobacteria bacterium TL4]
MQIEYINPFLASTMKVLKTMAQTEAKPGRPYKKEGQEATGIISAIIGLSGGTNGSISLTFSEPAIVGIVNNMLGESYTKLNDDVADAVGELTNMISGEARRTLAEEGYVFKAGIPQILRGEGHLIEHPAKGPVAVIPFKTDDGMFSVEACFSSEQYFDESKENQKKAAIKASNKSLVAIKLSCFLGSDLPTFKSYALKPNSQIMKPNFFLIPEYVGPTSNHDFCNFTALEVSVCPETFFASNTINAFRHSQNPSHSILEDKALQKALLPQLAEMKEMMGNLPDSMYKIERTIENGILAYQLAMRTSELLYKYDEHNFEGEIHKIGEYSLKAALLSKIEKSMDREHEFLSVALGAYRKILPSATGEHFFRCCFRVVALGVYLGEHSSAKASIALMIKYYQEHSDEITPEIAPRIKRYIQLVDKIYKSKEAFAMEKHQDRTDYLFLE